MQFTPKTEEEVDTRVLLPAGEYDAAVTQASDEISKSKGTEQIHLVLRVTDDDGHTNVVHDYLLEAMPGKLRHFCVATGMEAEYESGELSAAHCSGMDVRVRLGIEKGKDPYPDKNVVKDYISRTNRAPSAPRRQAPAPANGTAPSPEGLAKKAFLVVWNRFVGEFPQESPKRDEFFMKCFQGYFPTKDLTQVGPADWKAFASAVAKWDPINGWRKPAATQRPAAQEPPFGDDTFTDDSIPF